MTKPRELPSLEYLYECFTPDFENGDLIWNARPRHHFIYENRAATWNLNNAGRKISNNKVHTSGSSGNPHIGVRINGVDYQLHRILYFMKYGFVYEKIDHSDGNPLNNKISNLKDGTGVKNARNIRKSSSNTSGYTNISIFESKTGKMRYRVKVMKKVYGTFDTLEEALKVREQARKDIGGFSANHGENRIYAVVNKNREVEYHGAI